jgi:DNA sulfur modification protein DndB
MTADCYSFAAMWGRQGNHDYYIILCPLRLVPRILLFDEDEVPAKLRKGRSLDKSRVAEFAQYITEEATSYTLAPLIVSVDSEVEFISVNDNPPQIGHIQIPLSARMLVQDGQHRRAAIQRAVAENPTLGDDLVAIMLVPDPDFNRTPHIYAQLNEARTRRNLSQRILHDLDNPLAGLVRELTDTIPLFKGLTELERTSISHRSTSLFTLSAIYQATKALLGVNNQDPIDSVQVVVARQFWVRLGIVISEWHQVIEREVTAAYLRKHYVHAHSVVLVAIGMVGNALLSVYPEDWQERLHRLGKLDWSRDNTELWEGRAMVRGRMSKARDNVQLTVNLLKQVLELPLTDKEQELEKRLVT